MDTQNLPIQWISCQSVQCLYRSTENHQTPIPTSHNTFATQDSTEGDGTSAAPQAGSTMTNRENLGEDPAAVTPGANSQLADGSQKTKKVKKKHPTSHYRIVRPLVHAP